MVAELRGMILDMDKRFLAILATIAIIFVGILVVSQHSGNKAASGGQPSNHIIGSGAKNVTLVEYGDYQCPICEVYEPVVEQVRTAYTADIHFQFRNLPLSSLHPNAFSAARAAEAASLQGKFWEMHDTLYNQTNWQVWTVSSSPMDLFKVYAQQLGLDVNKFQSDYASEGVNSTIQADLSAFKATGQQQATPSFFLDGTFVDNTNLTDSGNRPLFDKFKSILDAEIAKH